MALDASRDLQWFILIETSKPKRWELGLVPFVMVRAGHDPAVEFDSQIPIGDFQSVLERSGIQRRM